MEKEKNIENGWDTDVESAVFHQIPLVSLLLLRMRMEKREK